MPYGRGWAYSGPSTRTQLNTLREAIMHTTKLLLGMELDEERRPD